jgi:hypothetical protein
MGLNMVRCDDRVGVEHHARVWGLSFAQEMSLECRQIGRFSIPLLHALSNTSTSQPEQCPAYFGLSGNQTGVVTIKEGNVALLEIPTRSQCIRCMPQAKSTVTSSSFFHLS